MAPLPPPEPARHLETTASLDARKLRFEINRMVLPMGVECSFGVINHPGASLAVPVLDDGRDPRGAMLPCPGSSDEVIHLFLARQLRPLEQPPAGDDDEDLEVLLMEPDQLDGVLASGDECLDGKSVTAWLRAQQLLGV